MLTDRAPVEFHYLSKRLLTDLVQHDDAARPRSKLSFDFRVRWFGLHVERTPPDFTNFRDLAMRSTELVRDNTGTLDVPSYFIHDYLDLHHGVFSPHMGWHGHVASYRGETTDSKGVPVFLALFGSASNVAGRRPRDEDTSDYYPSDMTGLYAYLDSIREPEDPEIDVDYRLDDLGSTQETLADLAMQHSRGGATLDIGPHEFLARVLIHHEHHRSRGGDFTGRVIVGTPIWIATPKPRPAP